MNHNGNTFGGRGFPKWLQHRAWETLFYARALSLMPRICSEKCGIF